MGNLIVGGGADQRGSTPSGGRSHFMASGGAAGGRDPNYNQNLAR